MNPAELFRDNLKLIDRVVAGVCRRTGLRDADAEDFASTAKLALIENDYAILRGFEERSSLVTFLTVIVQRLLWRERRRMWGRWHPSAEAERLGEAAVLLEKLLLRDRRGLEEAIPYVRAVDPSLDAAAIRALAARLPLRGPRPLLVALPDGDDHHEFVAADHADQRARDADARLLAERAGRVVRETLAALPLQDRMLLRFRFGADMSIADAARMLGVPQRPLYRRIEALLRQLREALENEGLDAAMVADIINVIAVEGADFDLGGKKAESPGTKQMESQP
jgi:RNA polymerase sigma factor (sigma-70 family)